jgi:methionyl-tRNA formyltransferase
LRLVFAGTPATALPALNRLLENESHEVAAVVTRPDAPSGRGRRPAQSPVAARARAAGIEVLTPARPKDPQFIEELERIRPDACPVVAYGALIPPRVLQIPRHGWLNVHFSLLPAWRGAAPVAHAILAGDEVTGATVFRLDEGLDTGPVYGVTTTGIGARETAGELLDRLANDGATLLEAVLDRIAAGELEPQPQPQDGVSLAPKLGKDDGRVDWAQPAAAIDRRVRATTPAPGAWTTFRGRRLALRPLTPIEGGAVQPGELAATRAAVTVGTGSTPVALGEVAPEGRSWMPAADWARGTRPAPGERLE